MTEYFAIADCNNFYASCERSFKPILRNKPIVVLSNNDGCVVARSEEAKAIGIGMGVPYWEVKHLIRKNNIHVFSSNYQLYGDLSERIMNIIHQHYMDVEVYSIDEAFMKIVNRGDKQILLDDACEVRENIFRSTGVPVTIGISKTKTLCKIANHIAKRITKEDVYLLTPEDQILSDIPVNKVWGIASAYSARLNKIGVKSVADLINVHEGWMRKEFGVVGLRLLKELKGFPCHQLEEPITQRKNMMVSRSFRKDVYRIEEITEAVSVYVTRLCEKLRKFKQATSQITIFLKTNPFRNVRKDGRQYFSQTIQLPLATNATNEVITHAIAAVKAIFEEGTNYKKAGILASNLKPQTLIQGNLFVNSQKRDKLNNLMESMDSINHKMGRNTLYFSSCSIPKKQKWSRQEQFSSPRYTTRWADILTVK